MSNISLCFRISLQLITYVRLIQAIAWRKDGKPLTPETFETILEFISVILQDISSVFVGDGWCPMQEQFTPQAFQLFSRRYFREQREKGRLSFEGPFEPL